MVKQWHWYRKLLPKLQTWSCLVNCSVYQVLLIHRPQPKLPKIPSIHSSQFLMFPANITQRKYHPTVLFVLYVMKRKEAGEVAIHTFHNVILGYCMVPASDVAFTAQTWMCFDAIRVVVQEKNEAKVWPLISMVFVNISAFSNVGSNKKRNKFSWF